MLTLQYLKKKFCPQKIEKTPLKVAQKIHFFCLTASTAQMAQTEEFMFQNVTYRPTVYRTWVLMLHWCSVYPLRELFGAIFSKLRLLTHDKK